VGVKGWTERARSFAARSLCGVARSPGVALVVLAVLAGAAVSGWLLHDTSMSDAGGFADAGRLMVSPAWRRTYDDPWVQAGPFELLICLACRTLGATARGVSVSMNLMGAAALLGVARHVLGRRWSSLLFVGCGALVLGVILDLAEIGHPSELFIALTWLLAARAARRDQVLLAGVLLGASAGFETWGLLGAPVLFLLPRFRHTVSAGIVALLVAVTIYAPFALGGDFHMFDMRWDIAGGLPARLFGEHSHFTWPMRLAEAVLVVSFGSALALALRRRTAAVVWIVPAATSICRIFLDPVRYGYYWDTSLVLMLIGFAPMLVAPRQLARDIHTGLQARLPAPRATDEALARRFDAARRLRVMRLVPAAGLILIALTLSWSHWTAPTRWTPDGLFYEAQAQELTGTPAATARQEVFFGPLAKSAYDTSGRLDGGAWIEYAAPFYRRRWAVPALAASLRPAVGSRALEIVSLLGYVLSGLLVYLLARRRFSPAISFGAGVFALWFPPLRLWSGYPLTDTTGVAALALAFAAASWAIRGRSSRLVLWASSVLLLSFTRDTAAIAVAGAMWFALAARSRRGVALALTGIAAAIPAPLFFGAPLRQTMAFTFSNNTIPTDTSWHHIFQEYGTFVRMMIEFDFPFRSTLGVTTALLSVVALLALRPGASSRLYTVRQAALALVVSFLGIAALVVAPLQLASWPDPVPFGILLIAALLPLFLPADGEEFMTLIRGGALGAVGYLFLLPQSTGLRLPLVLLPFAAIGIARGISLARAPSRAIAAPASKSREVHPAGVQPDPVPT
jgi:hypothetical protein